MKRIVLLALVGTLFCSTAGAGDFSLNLLAAYYPPNLSGYQSSGFAPINYTYIEGQEPPSALRSLGSTWGGAETKAVLSYTHSTPFLVGPGLMANNARNGEGLP